MGRTRRDEALARSFGDRVRSHRQAAGLSQEGLATVADVHRTYVGEVERGEVNVTLATIVRLAVAFGVDPGVLVEGLR